MNLDFLTVLWIGVVTHSNLAAELFLWIYCVRTFIDFSVVLLPKVVLDWLERKNPLTLTLLYVLRIWVIIVMCSPMLLPIAYIGSKTGAGFSVIINSLVSLMAGYLLLMVSTILSKKIALFVRGIANDFVLSYKHIKGGNQEM